MREYPHASASSRLPGTSHGSLRDLQDRSRSTEPVLQGCHRSVRRLLGGGHLQWQSCYGTPDPARVQPEGGPARNNRPPLRSPRQVRGPTKPTWTVDPLACVAPAPAPLNTDLVQPLSASRCGPSLVCAEYHFADFEILPARRLSRKVCRDSSQELRQVSVLFR